MMPAGAVAIILLVNGLQIGLPQPAFVQDGAAWIPGRAVLAAAGYEVQWQQEGNCVLLAGAEPPATIYLDRSEVVIGDRSERLRPPPRRVKGTLYLPVALFRLLGFEVEWEPEAKALRLSKWEQARGVVTIGELKADPPAYIGRRVRLGCEYVTLPGPGQRECLVQDREEMLRCVLPASGAGPSPGEAIRGAIGGRIDVMGEVRLFKSASMYIDILELHPTSGIAALSCGLNTDRASYPRGQVVLVEFSACNQTREAIGLGADVTAHLSIRDDAGGEVWQQELALPASMEPGETELASFRWEPGADVKPGRYVLGLESDMELWAHQACLRIEGSELRGGVPGR